MEFRWGWLHYFLLIRILTQLWLNWFWLFTSNIISNIHDWSENLHMTFMCTMILILTSYVHIGYIYNYIITISWKFRWPSVQFLLVVNLVSEWGVAGFILVFTVVFLCLCQVAMRTILCRSGWDSYSCGWTGWWGTPSSRSPRSSTTSSPARMKRWELEGVLIKGSIICVFSVCSCRSAALWS